MAVPEPVSVVMAVPEPVSVVKVMILVRGDAGDSAGGNGNDIG